MQHTQQQKDSLPETEYQTTSKTRRKDGLSQWLPSKLADTWKGAGKTTQKTHGESDAGSMTVPRRRIYSGDC